MGELGIGIDFNSEAYARKECDSFNAASLPPLEDGFFCEKCKNKRLIGIVECIDGVWYQSTIPCECQQLRKNQKNLKASRLEDLKSFDDYIAREKWQKDIKEKAQRFVNEPSRCFFIGGQSGIGKTHLCTAIALEMINKGKTLLYMCWKKEVDELTNFSDNERFKKLEEYANVDILYIDDFLKPHGDGYSRSEIGLAFDIVDRRYRNPRMITIISSELTIKNMISIDQATVGRIVEMADKYTTNIASDLGKNYRLKGII